MDQEWNCIDTDVTLLLPVTRLHPTTLTLSRPDRKLMDEIAHDQMAKCISLLKEDFAFRKLVRKNDVCRAIQKEVKAALNCKTHRMTFSLGLCSMDIDLELFGLDFFSKKRRVFSYTENTLGTLDASTWMRSCTPMHITKFVTQVIVWLRDGIIHGTVYSSRSSTWSKLGPRELLARYISEVRLTIPADDPFSGVEWLFF